MPTTATELDLVVKMTLTAWDAQNNQLNKFFPKSNIGSMASLTAIK